MSLHIDAQPTQIAPRVLLPGDPLRAKFIADNFLSDVQLYSNVRNALGFTGSFNGIPVSVQATGMGIPSFSIYAHELIHHYGVNTLIRVGTCGSLHSSLSLGDIFLAQGASTDSNLIYNALNRNFNLSLIPDFYLLNTAVSIAAQRSFKIEIGNVFTSDSFYNDYNNGLHQTLSDLGVRAVDMESAALYFYAMQSNTRALSILSVSDNLLHDTHSTIQQRQTAFTDMILLALNTITHDCRR